MRCSSCLKANTQPFRVLRRELHTPRPRLDLKYVRDNRDLVIQSCKLRGVLIEAAHVDQCIVEYDSYTKLTQELNGLLARRNELTKSLKRKDLVAEERQSIIDEATAVKPMIQQLQASVDAAESKAIELASVLPNAISPHTPHGGESKVRILSYINEENQYRSEEESAAMTERIASEASEANAVPIRVLDHVAVAKRFDLVDFDSASRTSGTGFYYLKNAAVLLELALVQYGLARAMARGWSLVRPPDLIRSEFVQACGFAPRDTADQQQIYETLGDFPNSLSLAGTAEIPLAAMGVDRVLPPSPTKFVGHGRAFRREAGARGADTRGLYRVHEFTKVELFAFAPATQSDSLYDEMLSLQRSIVRDLGLCARVLEMPTRELGASAFRKADIEAWIPSRDGWGEISSLSHCKDYQARRLNTRISPTPPETRTEFAHTLNGTAVACARILVPALETWYDPQKDVIRIPESLRPFAGGLDVITRP
ncbi:Serine--tRNA ligase, mitochondrial [Savitreella phatthalungensis]